MTTLTLDPGTLSLTDLRRVAQNPVPVCLAPSCHGPIRLAANTVQQVVDADRTVYGINTGFGRLARTRIASDQLLTLQRHLILSHSTGVGNLLGDKVVRLVMLLKINSLAQGYSGIRLEVVVALLALLNAGVYPCIPAKGSVGASGDLAPLAHLAAALIGEGEVRVDGEVYPAAEGLLRAGLAPLKLAPKEGLALLNGTQVSTALGLCGLFAIEEVFAAAVVTGSLSVEAALGSHVPFDDRIHAVRGHRAQREISTTYRALLQGSEINLSHADCDRVQDPYSLRCQPQVMGACLEHVRHCSGTLLSEANAVSDNPLVFADDDEILSGGNFHAEPVALAADVLAIAAAEVGALSERRVALLMDKNLSGLPAFLVEEGGLNSGFMVAHVTAASLASENKSLAHPASVDSLPTSANQEDHVSMAAHAARRLSDIADNVAAIVAVELLAACQGVDLRRPLHTSAPLQKALAMVRERVPFYSADRYFKPDIEAAKALVTEGRLNELGVLQVLRGLFDD
jgi:histidine ammonia-lyase